MTTLRLVAGRCLFCNSRVIEKMTDERVATHFLLLACPEHDTAIREALQDAIMAFFNEDDDA